MFTYTRAADKINARRMLCEAAMVSRIQYYVVCCEYNHIEERRERGLRGAARVQLITKYSSRARSRRQLTFIIYAFVLAISHILTCSTT